MITRRWTITAAAMAAACAGWVLLQSVPAGAQAPTARTATATTVAAPSWTPPKTTDGQPNMQGIWRRRGVGMREANPPPLPLWGPRSGPAYPSQFNETAEERGTKTAPARPKTGLIDPADGVLPWRPEADQARRAFLAGTNPPASIRHVEPNARCALPGPIQSDDRNAYQILQRPGLVVLQYEYNHATRMIHTDGRPHLPATIRQFMGDSTGRWEGNTLVVETTNYTDRTGLSQSIFYHSDALQMVERFTMTSPQTIDYDIVLEDPKLFTRPLKIAGQFYRADADYEMTEYACAEGTQTLLNIFGPPR